MIEKSYFCRRFLEEAGVPADRRPVWYDEELGQEGRATRVYVSASWFPSWAAWSEQAQIALAAAAVKYDNFRSKFVNIGSSDQIVGTPHFLLEREDAWAGGYTVWINALCPDEAQFYATVAEARERIAGFGKPQAGMRVASITEPLPLLPISSAEFQNVPGTVGATWADR